MNDNSDDEDEHSVVAVLTTSEVNPGSLNKLKSHKDVTDFDENEELGCSQELRLGSEVIFRFN